jgi:cell division septation protein DedD/nucleoid DNA-binding protein
MAYLGTYIRQLLSNREQVILPGFGSLVITEGKGVAGDDGKIEPPVPVVRFDPTHPLGDGKLARAYAEGEGIEPEEARQQLLELVDAIKFRLDKGESYKLDQVGVFSRDDDNRILFRKDPGWVIDPDAFGLETLDILELDSEDADGAGVTGAEDAGGEKLAGGDKHAGSEKHTGGGKQAEGGSEQEVAKKGGSRRGTEPVRKSSGVPIEGSVRRVERKPVNKWKIIWIVVGSLIAVLVLILLIPSGNGIEFGREGIVIRESEETVAPDKLSPDVGKDLKEEQGKTPVDQPVDEQETPAEMPGVQPKAPEHNYFIIAGSFQNLQNATELMNELQAKGFPAEMITTENRMYRVSVQSYAERDQAIRELPRVKSESGMDGAWVMTR